MKNIKNLAYSLIIGSLALGSCGEFGDLNLDPNRPSDPLTSSLLTRSLRNVSDIIDDATSPLYVQHLAEKQYTEASRYQTIYFNFNGFYSGPLMNLQRIIELNTDEETRNAVSARGSNNNQIAVARIMKAYFFSVLTDRWGEIPYTEALKGHLDFSPSYDTQEFIYTDLLKELAEAHDQIDEGAAVQGDFLFNGNMENWKRFSNSLRLVLALRLSDVAPQIGRPHFVAAYENGLLTSDFMYPYLQEANNQNPWFARYLTRVDYAISNTLYNYMAPLNDPRLPVYADPAAATQTIVPMPYGVTNTVAGSITNAQVSYLGSFFRAQNSSLPILTRSQLYFSLAEGVHRGWISGDAGTFYAEAIQASMEMTNVFNEQAFNAYIAQPNVAWNPSRAIELIGNQKWVALYLQGYEAWSEWSEWRRLGYPALSPAPDALNQSRQIPRRQAYPTTERDINTANWQEAVSRQGPDELDTKVWWDVN